MKKYISSLLFATLLFTSVGFTQQRPVDYLQVAGPVMFNGISYNLSWTSHPAPNYYKQEYLTKTDNSDHFKSMLMLEVLTGQGSVKEMVDAKIADLKKMQQANPLVNFELISNAATGEYLLDFLVSQDNATTGQPEIVERNVYRYKNYIVNGKSSGVILFAISSRSYGKDINPFLVSLKANRKVLVNTVSLYKIPAIMIAR